MPLVRRQREISQAPLPGVRKTAAETALSRGAGLEQAKAGIGHAISDFGETVARVGIAKFAQIQQEEREKANQIAALAMSNAGAKFEEDYFRHEQTGALRREGQAAMGVPEDFEEKFEKAFGDIEAMATNDTQRAVYQQIKARYYQSGYSTARRHTFAQMQAYGKSTLNSKVKNAANAAVVNAHDPARVAMEISEGESAIRNVAPQFGAGPDEVKEMVGTFKSQALGGVITRLITDGFDVEAKVYFEEHKDQITDAAVLTQLGEKVKRATTGANGERAAAEIWRQLAPGPNDDTSPISLDKMEAAAREKWGDDSDSLKATIDALRSRKQGVNDGRRERINAQDSAIWGAVFKGASLEELKRSPAFVNAPGEVQQRIGEYFRREGEHREALAASREGRAAAAESRAYTKAAREQQQLENDSFEAYHSYADPAVLRAYTKADILKALPELGRDHVTRLIEKQERIQASDAAYRSAVIDNDTFKNVAEAAGLTFIFKPPSQWSKEQRSLAGRMQEEVEREIANQQVGGKILSRADKESIAHTVLDAQALKPGGFWPWSGTTVRITDVPAEDRVLIENSLTKANRELAAKGQPAIKITPQAIIDAYMRKPQK